MRYNKLSIIVLLFFALTETRAQENHTDFLDPKSKLTWLGIDFTTGKFIGDDEAIKTMNVPMLIKSWNELMVTEQSKYDVAKMLHRKTIEMNVDVAMKHNERLPLTFETVMTRYVKEGRRFTPDSIANIVATYDFTGLSGNGIMFNVETFSKAEGEASVWVTFVDMDNKKVLFTRRIKAAPGGFGLRNYWAGSIYRIMKEVNQRLYNQWSRLR